MMSVADVLAWLNTLPVDSAVTIDDGGLMLVEVDCAGCQTEAYLEIGGLPERCAECERSNGPHYRGPCEH